MAYNNYYPQYYPQPNYAQQMPQQPQVVQQQNNGITWVQGENAAKSYPVSAGQSMLLMDSEDSVMYIKSTDQSGMPLPLRIFDYTERRNEHTERSQVSMAQNTDYISRSEFDAFKSEIRDELKRGVRTPNVNTKKIARED